MEPVPWKRCLNFDQHRVETSNLMLNLLRAVVVVVVVVYFVMSRQLYLALSANLGLLCMTHPGMGPLVYRLSRMIAE